MLDCRAPLHGVIIRVVLPHKPVKRFLNLWLLIALITEVTGNAAQGLRRFFSNRSTGDCLLCKSMLVENQFHGSSSSFLKFYLLAF